MQTKHFIDPVVLRSLYLIDVDLDRYLYDFKEVFQEYETNGYKIFLEDIYFESCNFIMSGTITFMNCTYLLSVIITHDEDVVYASKVDQMPLFDSDDFTLAIDIVINNIIPCDIWRVRAMYN